MNNVIPFVSIPKAKKTTPHIAYEKKGKEGYTTNSKEWLVSEGGVNGFRKGGKFRTIFNILPLFFFLE